MPLLLLLVLLGTPRHDDTESRGRIWFDADGCHFRLSVDADRLLQCVGLERPDLTEWTEEEILSRREQIFEYFRANYHFRGPEGAWSLEPGELQAVSGYEPMLEKDRVQFVAVSGALPWPAGDFLLEVRQDLFLGFETMHRHLLQIELGGEELSLSLMPTLAERIRIEDPTAAGLFRRCGRALQAGVSGTAGSLTTWLFWLALLLPALAHREMRAVGLAFLVAASLALQLAGHGLLEPAPLTIRCAAAFAVAFLAGENLLAPNAQLRWATALLFGLVFGLGFALDLEEQMEAVRRGRGAVLLAYNAGMLLTLGTSGLLLALARRKLERIHQEPRLARPVHVSLLVAGALLLAFELA